jgi:hypothetical protein
MPHDWCGTYTGLTIPKGNSSVNQIIHLRLLRETPFEPPG